LKDKNITNTNLKNVTRFDHVSVSIRQTEN